jgi:penicillin-binding protein 1B
MNLATARLGFAVGIEKVIDTLEKLGVKSEIKPYPSLFLGSFPLVPLEVAQVYQTIAASGFNVPVRAIREVLGADGNALSRYPYRVEAVFDTREMHLLQYALQEVMREGTGKSAYQLLPDALATAGKTGTTNDARDSWFAGMTGDYLGIVWVGRDDNGKTSLTGATGAMRVWAEMTQALPQRPFSPVIPEGIEYFWVSDEAFVRTDEGCRNARYLPFISGSEPTAFKPCQQGLQKLQNWFQRLFE